jgi:3'-phosphoadenosine 5'-phosphosulfate sulfotransferase (PAPS reductase)/FAD synthetase
MSLPPRGVEAGRLAPSLKDMDFPVTLVPRRGLEAPVIELFDLGLEASAYPIETAAAIDSAIAAAAPVFTSGSGGRDSMAVAYRVSEHLDQVGHRGPRYLIHADLGRVEWRDSLPVCERMASRLDIELIVVRRQAGDMMARWRSRWDANVARYADLACVKLILPWSTAATRYCTSELKSAVLSREIRRRHPTGDVVSAVGIRREENSKRARMPVSKEDARTTRARGVGHTWNPILAWKRDEVNRYIASRGDVLHSAYTVYGSTRVSCVYCVLGSANDLRAAAACSDNHDIFRTMVALEVDSTFSFQANRWLADVAPDLLDAATRARVQEAKERAQARMAAESRIPAHLLYVDGWPSLLPTTQEAELLAGVRREVAAAVGLRIQHTDRDSVLFRYHELMQERGRKQAATGELVTPT